MELTVEIETHLVVLMLSVSGFFILILVAYSFFERKKKQQYYKNQMELMRKVGMTENEIFHFVGIYYQEPEQKNEKE